MNETEVKKLVNQVTDIKDNKGNEVSLDQLKQIPWEVSPIPVTIVGTTFGNEIQTKILSSLLVSNFFLFYLCIFATARYFMAGN